MRGASKEALADLGDRLGTSRTLAEQATVGQELFAVAGLLRSDAALRRVLTDNSVAGETRAGLAETVFGKAVAASTLKLVTDAVSRRWTRGTDLSDAFEWLAVVATVRSAGAEGSRVGDELFALRRIVNGHPQLRATLSDPSRSLEDRAGLLHRLLDGKALPATMLLVGEVLASDSVDATLQRYLQLAAESRGEVVATVHAARELSGTERERLVAALSEQYDAKVQLHVEVDPQLIGGLRVEVGDEVLDGTVASRLDDARRRLAG